MTSWPCAFSDRRCVFHKAIWADGLIFLHFIYISRDAVYFFIIYFKEHFYFKNSYIQAIWWFTYCYFHYIPLYVHFLLWIAECKIWSGTFFLILENEYFHEYVIASESIFFTWTPSICTLYRFGFSLHTALPQLILQ